MGLGATLHLPSPGQRCYPVRQSPKVRRQQNRAARFPWSACRLCTQAREYVGDSPADEDVDYVCPSESSSVLAAMMKPFWCRPPILCVHQLTVTLPHSVSSAGWCPSSSACSPTLLVKASAWAKREGGECLSAAILIEKTYAVGRR